MTAVPLTAGDAAQAPPTVSVVLLGPAGPTPDALRAGLHALPSRLDVGWSIAEAPSAAPDDPLVVLCDAGLTDVAVRRWPGAAVIALVPDRDDGAAVVRALGHGADSCVRGCDTGVIAAYLQSVARRLTRRAAGADR
jgi:hypothetical protein